MGIAVESIIQKEMKWNYLMVAVDVVAVGSVAPSLIWFTSTSQWIFQNTYICDYFCHTTLLSARSLQISNMWNGTGPFNMYNVWFMKKKWDS